MIEFKVPDLGEGIDSADIVSVLVKEGHVIEPEQNVLELETGKAVVELPCPDGGRVLKVHVKPGDKVTPGQTLLSLEPLEGAKPAPKAEEPAEEPEAAAEPAPEPQPESEPARAAEPEPTPEPAPAPVHREDSHKRPAPAGPATRKLARELGVDLHKVSGSGPGGRITAEDVRGYVKKIASSAASGGAAFAEVPPLPDFSRFGEVNKKPLGAIRRATGENVSLAWRTIPHVTQHDKADVTELESARKRFNEGRDSSEKITMTVLLVKAVLAALRAFPHFNASIDPGGGQLILKNYYNVGVAVDTEHGLLVPVIKNVDRKSVLEISSELGDLAERAKLRKLVPEEMQGGTFTISNLGGIGGTGFTPIVNWPEVAILGVSRSAWEYVPGEDGPEERLMMPLSLSYDHRAIDGADAARFARRLSEVLEDPIRLLIEG